MNTKTPSAGTMKDEMRRALQLSEQTPPSVVERLLAMLGEVQEAFREDGYPGAVLELREGLQTNYGLRYTIYLRDVAWSFEHIMFSVFITEDQCAFQADGQIATGLTTEDLLSRAHDYFLLRRVVVFSKGLLKQFGKPSASDVAVTQPS